MLRHPCVLFGAALVPALAPMVTVVLLLACVVAANAHGVELPRLMQVLTTAWRRGGPGHTGGHGWSTRDRPSGSAGPTGG